MATQVLDMISGDPGWIERAVELPQPPDAEFFERLCLFHDDPSSSGCNENSTLAIENLRRAGIVPFKDSQDNPPSLARFIADSLLNYSLRNSGQPCSYSFHLKPRPGSIVKLPPRSTLVLHYIAYRLNINMFIFSSRAKAIRITPPGAKHTVAFFHRIDSFTTVSEFLVLGSSLFAPKPRPIQEPRPFSSDFARATRREEERKTVSDGKKRKGDDLKDDDVKSAYRKTCHEWVARHASSSIQENEEKEDSKAKLFRQKKSGLPKGVRKEAFEDVRATHEKAKSLSEDVLKRKLGDDGTVSAWNRLVETDFDAIWEMEVNKNAERADKGKTLEVDEDDEDTDDSAETNKRELRTCTATLRLILRPDILDTDDEARIQELFEKSQRDVTIVMEELSILTMKAVNVIASGKLYTDTPSLYHNQSSPHAPGEFDITKLLPDEFMPRDPMVHPVLQIAPLPQNLQDHLSDTSQKKEDITTLLSHSHLMALYSRFLSSAGKKCTADHQTWSRLEDIIRAESDVADLSKAPNGMSTTIGDHIKEFGTNVQNMWQGGSYHKLLDYLMRILLRLHLAPRREQRSTERAREFSERKAQLHNIKQQRNQKKHNKRKIKSLCDELESWLRKGPEKRDERIKEILLKLSSLNDPVASNTDLTSSSVTPVDRVTNPNDSEPSKKEIPGELYPDFTELDQWDLEYWNFDDEDLEEPDTVEGDHTKESTRTELKALQALLKVLLESPKLSDRPINGEYVRKSAFVGTNFTKKQCDVVAKLVNTLRPYVPRRRPNPNDTGPKTLPPVAHVALRAPLMIIANTVLRRAGYPQFTRAISPDVSPSSTHALHLSATALYEVLCSKGEDKFDILDTNKTPLTYVKKVRDHKRAVFGAFFDIQKVEQLCRSYKLEFAYRLSFVDRFTVRVMGEVIPKGPDRPRGPVRSQYEAHKKKKKHSTASYNWTEEVQIQGLDGQEISRRLDEVDQWIIDLEAKIKPLRKLLDEKERVQSQAASNHREVSKAETTSPERTKKRKDAYRQLQAARQEVRNYRSIIGPLDADLRRLIGERYYWNNVLKAYNGESFGSQNTSTEQRTTPTLDFFTVEDSVERLDISQLPRDKIVFAGTDPGIKIMSVTCAQTLQQIETHINRFQVLYPGDDEDQDSQVMMTEQSTSAMEIEPIQAPPVSTPTPFTIPRPSIITAPQINEVSGTRRIARRREIRLQRPANAEARKAMEGLSKREQVLKTAQNLTEIDLAQKHRRESRDVLKQFESSKARCKDLHNQRIRTKRTWAKLAANERKVIQDHGRTENTILGEHVEAESAGNLVPLFMYGAAGTGVGSRIGGTARRGGKKMREQHMRYGVVGITNEHCTSQTCACCFQRLRPARARRVINGVTKTVRLHGAMECINPQCETVRAGNTIKSRDLNAALCIAIAGGSRLLRGSTLNPFNRSKRPSINTSQAELEQSPPTLSSSIQFDAMGAPAGTAGKDS